MRSSRTAGSCGSAASRATTDVRVRRLVARHVPLLAEAAKPHRRPQVRNRGTLGGSIAHADPAADYLPVMVVTASTVVVTSVRGTREIPAGDFFVDVLTSAVEIDEVVTEVRDPVLGERDGSAYRRLARLEGSFPIVNAAAIVRGGSRCRPHVAIGGVAGRPVLVDVSASVDATGAGRERGCRGGGIRRVRRCVRGPQRGQRVPPGDGGRLRQARRGRGSCGVGRLRATTAAPTRSHDIRRQACAHASP